jgi:hypothetical protein
MGLFRRTRAADPAGSAPAGGDPVASSAAAAPAAPEPDPGPSAWETLPPIATTTTAPEPTFKIGAAVKDDLVALDSPRLSHGMGHLVSADGPPGIVSGLATAGVERTAGEPRPDGGAVAPSAHLDMPVLQRRHDGDGGLDEHHEHDGHDHSGDAAVLAPRIVQGDWSPPASPLVASTPPPERHLPLAPAPVQRQAAEDVPAPPDAGSSPEAAARPEVPATTEPDATAAPEVTAPETTTPEAAVPPATTLAAPSPPVQRRAIDEATAPVPAPTPPVAPVPVQRRAEDRPLAPVQRSASGLPLAPSPAARPSAGAERGEPVAPRDAGEAAAGTAVAPAMTAPVVAPTAAGGDVPAGGTDTADATDGAGPTGTHHVGDVTGDDSEAPTLQRLETSLAAPAAPLVPAVPTVAALAAPEPPGELPLAGGPGGPIVQRRADEGEGTFRPRLGGVGPPIELPAGTASPSPPVSAPTSPVVQRSVAPAGGDMDLVIRQRPRGTRPDTHVVSRTVAGGDETVAAGEPGDAPLPPASAPAVDRPDVAVRAVAPVQRRLDRLAVPETVTPLLSPASAVPPAMPLAPIGRSSAGSASPAAESGPGVVPLSAQRSLASAPVVGPAVLRSPSADGPHASAAAAAAVPTWPVASGGSAPAVQRWPDLGSVRDLGGGTVTERAGGALAAGWEATNDAASGVSGVPDQALSLAGRGRDAVTGGAESLLGSAPDLPTLPAAPEMPLAGLPRVPQMPQVPALPSLPEAPSLPDVPALPGGLGSGAQNLAAAAGVPMREITFPAPVEAPAPAAAPAAGGAAAGADGAAGAAAGGSSSELDDLAHKLYDRIRWRLRTELRLDLERTGLGAGVRR